jgi:hypothetical protein
MGGVAFYLHGARWWLGEASFEKAFHDDTDLIHESHSARQNDIP